MIVAVGVLALLALVSRQQDWQLVGLHWWVWLVLAIPGLVLCADLWLGMQLARTRLASLVLLGVIVLGNIVGLVVLIAALITAKKGELGGGQLLLTAAAIWIANGIVFGLVYWDVDDGGPWRAPSTSAQRRTSSFPRTRTPSLHKRDGGPGSGTTCTSR